MRNLKTSFVTAIAVIISCSVYAQDKIYKTDGTVIESKVKKVDPTTVIYRRFDNQDGPEYTILKKQVNKIVYQNGTTDVFDDAAGKGDKERSSKSRAGNGARVAKKYGDNFISITPAVYTASVDGTINDAGIGATYERLLDKNGHIGISVPVMICFASSKDFNNYTYYYYGSGSVTNNYSGNYHSFYFMPGLKFYPAPGRVAVRYSLEASLFCAFGTEPVGVYDYNNYGSGAVQTNSPYDTYHYTMFGLMLSNSVNITAGKHAYLALDLGMGVPLSDNRHSNSNTDNGLGIVGPFIRFGFKVGYRY